MDTCGYGFYLSSGYIGYGADTLAFDNIWHGSWGGGFWQTYNNGFSLPTLSKMYVRMDVGAAIFDPWSSSSLIIGNQYGPLSPCGAGTACFGNGLIHASDSGTLSSCVPASVSFPLYRNYEPGVKDIWEDDTLKERSANRSSAHIPERMKWIEQMHIWNALQAFPAMADSSAVLAKFRDYALDSRYAWLNKISAAVYGGNFVEAQTLMNNDIDAYANGSSDSATGVVMADVPDADYVVGNYLSYYDLYIKYLDNSLSNDDSAQVITLAGMCPFTDGEIVYEARNLAGMLGNLMIVSDDSCVQAAAGKGSNAVYHGSFDATDVTDQAYHLYPNPNSGTITISQKIADDRSVRAEVIDAMGRVIYSDNLNIEHQNARLQLRNVSAGLYLLRLTDADGKVFTYKFVVQ